MVNPADARVIDRIQQATRGSRSLLRSLALRGKAIERDDGGRSAFLLEGLRSHPLYKGGRLAFDMLEIEDLMLDEAPEAPLAEEELTRMVGALAERGRELADVLLRAGSDARAGASFTAAQSGPAGNGLPRITLGPAPSAGSAVEPELLSSDYLYDYVVVGFLDLLGRDAGPP